MIDIKGKYGSARIFTDNVEKQAMSDLYTLLGQKFSKDLTIRIMPDVHAGAGCVIGYTATEGPEISPNLIGVDIGCGMLAVDLGKLSPDHEDLEYLNHIILTKVPLGKNVHKDPVTEYPLFYVQCIKELGNESYFQRSIGTLGGGNHFIELAKNTSNDHIFLIIHSGSRNLGKQVADHYQKLAIKSVGDTVPKDLCYLDGEAKILYGDDVAECQSYAQLNRATIAGIILKELHFPLLKEHYHFETVHNYIDAFGMIRKGAVAARKGQVLLIPMNMRDGSLLCIGKGNPDWNFSAPHGAGRIMSRGKAKKSFSMNDYRASMQGIFSTCVTEGTLDESPMAYKPMVEIVGAIGDTVDVEARLIPILNVKAS